MIVEGEYENKFAVFIYLDVVLGAGRGSADALIATATEKATQTMKAFLLNRAAALAVQQRQNMFSAFDHYLDERFKVLVKNSAFEENAVFYIPDEADRLRLEQMAATVEANSNYYLNRQSQRSQSSRADPQRYLGSAASGVRSGPSMQPSLRSGHRSAMDQAASAKPPLNAQELDDDESFEDSVGSRPSRQNQNRISTKFRPPPVNGTTLPELASKSHKSMQQQAAENAKKSANRSSLTKQVQNEQRIGEFDDEAEESEEASSAGRVSVAASQTGRNRQGLSG